MGFERWKMNICRAFGIIKRNASCEDYRQQVNLDHDKKDFLKN